MANIKQFGKILSMTRERKNLKLSLETLPGFLGWATFNNLGFQHIL